jgi:hypothetical protein
MVWFSSLLWESFLLLLLLSRWSSRTCSLVLAETLVRTLFMWAIVHTKSVVLVMGFLTSFCLVSLDLAAVASFNFMLFPSRQAMQVGFCHNHQTGAP